MIGQLPALFGFSSGGDGFFHQVAECAHDLPSTHPAAPKIDFVELRSLIPAAAGITLISFTSGVLTSKSFARRGGYEIDANQEMIGFGACNLASGMRNPCRSGENGPSDPEQPCAF